MKKTKPFQPLTLSKPQRYLLTVYTKESGSGIVLQASRSNKVHEFSDLREAFDYLSAQGLETSKDS